MFTYTPPSPFKSGTKQVLFTDWLLEGNFFVRSARPLSVLYGVPTDFGFLYYRPNVNADLPVYVADGSLPGGRRLNRAAFTLPQALVQGTLGRNALRGFGLNQFNVALRKCFKFNDETSLQFGAEIFNLFNRPNFADPVGNEISLGVRGLDGSAFLPNSSFGGSSSMLGRGPWSAGQESSTNSSNGLGGPRVIQLSVKFQF
jgi:hypothetical protein